MSHTIHEGTVNDRNYYTIFVDGFTTGPCPSAEVAQQRIAAWLRGDEITEAAPGQASVLQMAAALAWAKTAGIRDGGAMMRAFEDAIGAGLHTIAWIHASELIVRHALHARKDTGVGAAGGAKIRREPVAKRGNKIRDLAAELETRRAATRSDAERAWALGASAASVAGLDRAVEGLEYALRNLFADARAMDGQS